MTAGQLPSEVLFTSAYALLLLGVAFILEQLAKHSRRRADQYELAGFRYDSGFDHWECPEGHHLVRIAVDSGERLARYRASAEVCNRCKSKLNCTDSDSGREIEHRLDLWFRSGLSQFHRGLSLVLVLLSALLALLEGLRHRDSHSEVVLSSLFIVTVMFGVKLLRRRSEARVNPQFKP